MHIVADNLHGSGVVVREDGIVLTAYHVVRGASSIIVEFPDGSREEGVLRGRDIGRDLAVISAKRTGLNAIPFADPGELRVGQSLIKLGYGAGVEGTAAVTFGVVSTLLEPTRVTPARVQTDNAISSGDSGAPLITRDGRMVAVVTTKLIGIHIEGISYGSLLENGDSLVDRMAEGEVICQPAPPLTPAAADASSTYRNSDWGWFIQLPTHYSYLDFERGALFHRSDEPVYPVDARSQWPALVYVYPPWLKTAYPSAEALISAALRVFEDQGLGIHPRNSVREVCRGSDLSWEQDFRLVNQVRGYVEENRFLVVDDGSLWYLLHVVTWPNQLDRYSEETDTILYSFRSNRTPLEP